MNIICDKTLLSAAIDGVSKAVTLRSTIPVLEGILLKAEGFQLTLTGYDLEMGIVTTIEANVKEPGEIVLNAKLLSSMISRMPAGQITIQSADNGKTTIQSGVAQFEIQSMAATDFPELPNTGAEETLTIPTGVLRDMIDRTLYAVSNRIPAHYHRAEVPKRDGGARVLRVPDPVLKDIQRRIARVLLSGMPVSPHATAYRYGAGVVENARRHVGRPELLKLDILHFFDSIRYIQVKEAAFPAEIYAEPLRILLSMLCYDRDVLPQGAPTSPWIANLVLRPFDEKLGAWCRARGVVYTRYCDDLAFSGTALDGVEAARYFAGLQTDELIDILCEG